MTAPNVATHDSRVALQSEVLGPITVDCENVIEFPHGLYGFPDARTFALLPAPREGIFWLQSADYSALAFLLVDPFTYFPGHYQIDLADTDLARLGTRSASDLLVLSIVTMPPSPDGAYTANLQAPLLFNVRDRFGYQSIRPEDGFGAREAFDVDAPAKRAL